ncbi:MAG: IgGFc-binding protein [Nannocystaceae bacterium]
MTPRRLTPLALLLATACASDDGSASGTLGGSSSATTTATTTATTDEPTTSAGETTVATESTTATTTTTTTTGTTTEGCLCTPGEPANCGEPDTLMLCAKDCVSEVPFPCGDDKYCTGAQCVPDVCEAGTSICDGEDLYQTCGDYGEGYGLVQSCPDGQLCLDGECLTRCAHAEATQSSVGCSFFAHTMDNYYPVVADALVVGNVDSALSANVQLYRRVGGVDVAEGDPVVIAPGAVAELPLTAPEIDGASELRADGAYHLVSDLPVVAYQHAPIGAQSTNDASMLLPEHTLGKAHVIASAPEGNTYPGHLSYFVVIAAVDGTEVRWRPPVDSLAGVGVPGVKAGGEGVVKVDRLGTLQIAAAAKLDLSGTIVTADQPIWVIGASACASVPITLNTCDHLEEQMLPLETWGKTYVALNSPKRGTEEFHWRIFGGADGVTVTTTPDVSGGPFDLQKGEWKAFTADQSFVVTATGPVLPVHYLESQNGGAGTGDPSTVQMVPVEQFLGAYAFATGTGYDKNYVQVIRKVGGNNVNLDGKNIGGYADLGDYQITEIEISEGAHFIRSTDPFGIINVGYTSVTSYAYPGGMRLAVINPQ